MNKIVWTWGYFPFTMGGSVNRPIKTELPCAGPFDLGSGYVGYVFENKGKWHVVEDISGGLVGFGKTIDEALAQVRADIAEGDPKTMAAQIMWAAKDLAKAEMLEPEKFLELFRG